MANNYYCKKASNNKASHMFLLLVSNLNETRTTEIMSYRLDSIGNQERYSDLRHPIIVSLAMMLISNSQKISSLYPTN